MLHPALSRALATAHIEDLHRAATPRRTIRVRQGDLNPRAATPRRTIRLRRDGLNPRESQAGVGPK